MEVGTTVKIIRALADGVDPITGEIFPYDSVYQHPQVIRALFLAVQALEYQEKHTERKRNLPKNAGTPWTPSEDAQLAEEFDCGKSMKELAQIHQRTHGAIEARLVKLGKVEASYQSKNHF